MSSSRNRARSTTRRSHTTSNLPDRDDRRQSKSPCFRADNSWFEEVFRCYICLQNLTKPTICPKCSKLCCEPCIKKWLREQKEECPHCRANIDQTHLVPCRFLE
ncbi:hypothetical protein DSO57_1025635 [Entomophthora muscae]|uniref:Uncharacterized protein n=1 Tax=Entomophthora muscae TaxID=34485 RepID=A0ACC2RH13_9FUNG|nr:hypothetical protein DSO57_1025635 [Entomophthora muscae]